MKKYIPHALLVIILVCGALFTNRVIKQVIFNPGFVLHPVDASFEQITFPAQDGAPLHALYLSARPDADTILFFHGNTYNATHYQHFAQRYARHGYGVFLFDYRGYGQSEGPLSERTMYQDADSAVKYLTEQKHIPAEKIVLWGHSLGSAAALHAENARPDLRFKALILQSPFFDTPLMAYYLLTRKTEPQTGFDKAVLQFFTLLLTNKRFDNAEKISRVRAPLLVGYAIQDHVIPWQMSRKLAEQAPRGTQTYQSFTAHHADFDWMEPQALEFLNRSSANP